MNRAKFIAKLESLGACEEALEWIGVTKGTPKQLWETCERADWLFWIAGRSVDRKTVVWAAAQCARMALRFVPAGEERARLCIEAVEGWCKCTVDIETVRAAAYATYATYATYAANAAPYAAGYAAYAATYAAAYAANADTYAAARAAAVYATYAATYAANAATYAAARQKHRTLCCNIIRDNIKLADIKKGLGL